MQNRYDTVCCLTESSVKELEQPHQRLVKQSLTKGNHVHLNKRYQGFMGNLENDKSLFKNNVEHLSSKRRGEICVRSRQTKFDKHQKDFDQTRDILVVCKAHVCQTSFDRPSKAPAKARVQNQVLQATHAKQGVARMTNPHSRKTDVGARHKGVPLPITALSPLLQQSKGDLLTNISLLNTRREQVRKKRSLLLQRSVSQSLKDCQRVKDLSQQGWKELNLRLIEQGHQFARAQVKSNVSKGVWRGFINTFMRDGERLRYQKILRKALLAL